MISGDIENDQWFSVSKRYKEISDQMFSGSIEIDQWHEMGRSKQKYLPSRHLPAQS